MLSVSSAVHTPWQSTDMMSIRQDKSITFPDILFPSHIANGAIPFVATTPLGPKNVPWDVAGIFIPSEHSDKVILW